MSEKTFWLHIDMTHPDFDTAKIKLRDKFKELRVNNLLSVNKNQYNTEVLIKIVVLDTWLNSAAADFIRNSPMLIKAYTRLNHNEAILLVNNTNWTGATVAI